MNARDEFIREWNVVNNAFENPSMDDTIKYKRCGDFIVQMKRMQDTKDNEMRAKVVDARYAKFRANKLMVMRILDTLSNVFVDSIKHSYKHIYGDIPIEYRVGKIALPNGFEDNVDIICAEGIHYFNTLFAAYCYVRNEVMNSNENGTFFCFGPTLSRRQAQEWFARHFHQFYVHC